MNRETLVLTVAVFLAGALAGFVVGRYTQPNAIWEKVAPNPAQVIEHDGPVPPEFYEGGPADEIVRYVIRERLVTDTVHVPVPQELAEDPDIGLVSGQPVDVNTPVFGDPTVTVTTYPVEGGAYEQHTYVIRPHPFQYGIEAEAFYQSPLQPPGEAQDARSGLGASVGAYLGWRGVQPRVALEVGPQGVLWKGGVRFRFGR